MSRKLIDLAPAFKIKVEKLIDQCDRKGVIMRPFFTLRTPHKQAKIWRSTRSTEEVLDSCNLLERSGAVFLADVLWRVGPQFSPAGIRGHLTRALPGQSWHQWGEAIDCYWYDPVERVAKWDAGGVGYRVYAEAATQAGLTAGLYWGARDAVHIQRSRRKVLDEYDWTTVDRDMQIRFGEDA